MKDPVKQPFLEKVAFWLFDFAEIFESNSLKATVKMGKNSKNNKIQGVNKNARTF